MSEDVIIGLSQQVGQAESLKVGFKEPVEKIIAGFYVLPPTIGAISQG